MRWRPRLSAAAPPSGPTPRPQRTTFAAARKRFLAYLAEEHRFLQLRGFSGDERVPMVMLIMGVIMRMREGYHIPLVHPALTRAVDVRRYAVTVHDGGRWHRHSVPTVDGAPTTGAWAFLYPNLALNLYPTVASACHVGRV